MRSYDEIAADAADERPFSNGTEFEIWADSPKGCWNCVNDDDETEKYCPILSVAITRGVWPKEWTREKRRWQIGDKTGEIEGVGECTEFEERRDYGGGDPDPEPTPPPAPEIDGQMDMFEVFAEQITEHIGEQVTV